MRSTTRSKYIQRIRERMYPEKCWVNPLDWGHRFNRLAKYRKYNKNIGVIGGINIIRSNEAMLYEATSTLNIPTLRAIIDERHLL